MPTRDQVLAQLDALIVGSTSREQAAMWAEQFLGSDEFVDANVWEGITALLGADLKESPDVYLHDHDNIIEWRRRLLNTTG